MDSVKLQEQYDRHILNDSCTSAQSCYCFRIFWFQGGRNVYWITVQGKGKALLTRVRLAATIALQSLKWQLIGSAI